MQDFQKYLINEGANVKEALVQLSALSPDLILFVLDKNNKLLGSITDGDIRRGLIKGINLNDQISKVIQKDTKSITIGDLNIQKIIDYKRDLIQILPIVNEKKEIQRIINFREYFSLLPIDVVIMAGGQGKRLRPLTEHTPKPLLNVGDRSIIEHNINRFIKYGISNFWISINYRGDLIKNHLGAGPFTDIKINYIEEDKPLGTIGALSKGYRQRVGLAQAIIHDPKVLILDEPTSGLDPNQLVEIRELIKSIGKEKTVMLSTHIMQEVDAICDRVVIINKGEIVADDKAGMIGLDINLQTVYVEFDNTVSKNQLKKIQSVQKIEQVGTGWLLETSENIDLRKTIAQFAQENNLLTLTLKKEEQSLEQVFKNLTKN